MRCTGGATRNGKINAAVGALMKRNRMKRRRRRCKVRKSAGFQFKSEKARELGIYAKPFMMSGMLTPSMEAICLPA